MRPITPLLGSSTTKVDGIFSQVMELVGSGFDHPADQHAEFKALLDSRYPIGGVDLAHALGQMIDDHDTRLGDTTRKPVGTAARLSLQLRVESPEVLDRLKRNALHLAAQFGSSDVVRSTFGAISDRAKVGCLKAVDIRGWSVLHHAVQRNTRTSTPADTSSVLEFLLKVGATAVLSVVDMHGNNAAHRACLQNKSAAAILLLSAMHRTDRQLLNDVTSENEGLRTCLHIAALYGLNDVVAWLLNRHAILDLRDKDNSTAWELCTNPRRKSGKNPRTSNDFNDLTSFLDCYFLREAPPYWYRAPAGSPHTAKSLESRETRVSEKSSLFDPSEHEPGAFPPSSAGPYVLRENRYVWTLAFVKWAIHQRYPKANAAKTAVKFAYETFRESGDSHNWLIYRGPGVVTSWTVFGSSMPYLYSASWKYIRERRLDQSVSRVCRVGDKSPKEVHWPLTLDEYCNPWLTPETLLDRNQDQVVWRYERERLMKEPVLPSQGFARWKYEEEKLVSTQPMSESQGILDTARLLTVHQVWVYLVDDVLVFAFPEVALKEGPIAAALSRDPDVQWSKAGNGPHSLAVKRTVKSLSAFIDLVERSVLSGLSEPPLKIFQKSIVRVAEQVEAYFKEQTPRDQVMAASDEKQYLHVISDIREELSMILSVISEQEEVWKEVDAQLQLLYPNEIDSDVTQRMSATTDYLQKLTKRIERLDKDAERVQALIPQILDLKRSYVAMKESHWTAVMGAAIFGFTVVTIIFTPLSFVMALLAVPTESLLMADDHKRRFLGWVTGTTEIVSLIITAAAAGLAYRFFKSKTRWSPVLVSWWMQKLHELSHNNAPKVEKAGPDSKKQSDAGTPDGADAAAARKRRGHKQSDLEEGHKPKE
ncbi:hypothetical protein LTR74_004986 [Friedmanniomyces endolithicus]|nr:hypothetical protein LTR74_004986 [Friedmanniomyces endolithicus]